jgi:hypothetical protein
VDEALKLATTDQLLDELKDRFDSVVMGFTADSEGRPIFHLLHYGRPLECLGLAVALRREVSLAVSHSPEV